MQRWLTALVMVAVVPALRAQVALCAQYGGTFLSGNNSGDGNVVRGVTLGAYFARSHAAFFSFGVDARGTHQTSTDGVTQLTGGLIGPRLAFRTPVLGFKPYVEALGGAAHVEYIKSNEGVSTTNFQYQLLGGEISRFCRISTGVCWSLDMAAFLRPGMCCNRSRSAQGSFCGFNDFEIPGALRRVQCKLFAARCSVFAGCCSEYIPSIG
jgi:hypothetical protein